MAWEKRRRGTFYYRSRRVGDRVHRDYMGRGEIAELSAQLDSRRREQRKVNQATWAEFVSRIQHADALVDNLARHCRLLATAVFVSSGYHSHNGEWRRRRVYRTQHKAGPRNSE